MVSNVMVPPGRPRPMAAPDDGTTVPTPRGAWGRCASGGGEAQWHRLEGVVEVGPGAQGLPGHLDGRERREQLLEEDPTLQAGEVHAQAEVLADAEGELRVGAAVDVEGLAVGEDLLVAVGRRVVHRHLV